MNSGKRYKEVGIIMNKKVVVGLRTKNEEWVVDRTLNALSSFCDTVVVYDDDSTDKTEEICRSYDCVDWKHSVARDPHIWNAGEQATNLFSYVASYDPDYIFILDADEVPTPSIVDFFDSIDENINLWRIRMVNLFGDEKHYRTDAYRTPFGQNINWDPFTENAWRKYALLKYDRNTKYTYEPLKVGLGSFGPHHPAPNNVPTPHQQTEDFYIIHYGKISPAYLSGEKQAFYAKNDEATGVGTFKERLAHHMACSGFGKNEPRTLVKCKKEWFWNSNKAKNL
jgi:glycosyltransferase involved in cell wall biosynthesis